MVFPAALAPAATAASGGLAGIAGATFGGGGGKTVNKTRKTSIQQESVTKDIDNTSIQRTYSPQVTRKINYNPQVAIESPGSSFKSTVKQKDKQGVQPSQPVVIRAPTEQRQDSRQRDSQEASSGLRQVALAAALVGGAYFLSQ